jgi:hypothetical protein
MRRPPGSSPSATATARRVYGNYILGDGREGSNGLRVYGGGHKIYNNYIAERDRRRHQHRRRRATTTTTAC